MRKCPSCGYSIQMIIKDLLNRQNQLKQINDTLVKSLLANTHHTKEQTHEQSWKQKYEHLLQQYNQLQKEWLIQNKEVPINTSESLEASRIPFLKPHFNPIEGETFLEQEPWRSNVVPAFQSATNQHSKTKSMHMMENFMQNLKETPHKPIDRGATSARKKKSVFSNIANTCEFGLRHNPKFSLELSNKLRISDECEFMLKWGKGKKDHFERKK